MSFYKPTFSNAPFLEPLTHRRLMGGILFGLPSGL